MKNRNELVEQVSREIIQEGINLEMDWNFGDVNGKRGIIEFLFFGKKPLKCTLPKSVKDDSFDPQTLQWFTFL